MVKERHLKIMCRYYYHTTEVELRIINILLNNIQYVLFLNCTLHINKTPFFKL